jgi:hypothetical protein
MIKLSRQEKAISYSIRILLVFIMFTIVLAPEVKAAEIGFVNLEKTKLYYHYTRTAKPKGLVIFLHSSVKAYQGMIKSRPIGMDTLLEHNRSFIQSFTASGYDIVMPVCFNEYNWLEPSGAHFVDTLTKMFATGYSSIIISGFSDGGTGAYRIFYKNASGYSALLVFNGYPQLGNFYKTVDYKCVSSQKVIFVSQRSDKVVPYEFLLTEYRRQKLVRNASYFMLTEGKHEFRTYTAETFEKCAVMLELQTGKYENTPDSTWFYPAVDGLVINNEIIELYKFRSSIARKYGMNRSECHESTLTHRKVGKDSMSIYPVKLSQADMLKPELEFILELNGLKTSVIMVNFSIIKTW